MTKAKKPRVKKTKLIIDFITANGIRYIMNAANINECGQIETSDITIKHLYDLIKLSLPIPLVNLSLLKDLTLKLLSQC